MITGASTGIGAATAELLASNGASVVIVARGAEGLRVVAERCAGRAFPMVADMTGRENVRRVVADTLARVGRIDVWINNVGQGITRAPSQLTDDDIDAMIRTNVKSALYGMQEVLATFKERNAGHVINISSMLGRLPYALPRSAYTASKHFLNALTANFRDEVQATHPGIQFSLVSPPAVRTNFGLNALHGGVDSRALPDTQAPEDVARVIADVIESRVPDSYTRPGSQQRVAKYYASLGVDPKG